MLFAYGCNVGGSVVISRLFGAGLAGAGLTGTKKSGDMRLAVTTLFLSGAVFALLITILGMVFSGFLLDIINTPDILMEDSKTYLFVFLIGLVFMYIFNIACGVFTALGDSITPGIFLIASNIIILVLDILSARYTSFGVAGLAWSAVISQAVAAVFTLVTLRVKIRCFDNNAKTPLFSLKMLVLLMKNIVPAMLHSSVSAVGNVMIQSVINPMGIAAIAGTALGGKINGFASGCIDSVPDGNSAYAAQNIGAGKLSRVRSGFRAALIIVLTLSGILTLAVIIFADPIITLFVDHNATFEAVSIAKTYIISAACVYPLMGAKFLCDDILRAAGRMKLYLLTTVNNLVLRVVLVFALAPSLGVVSVFIGYTAALAATALVSILIYRKKLWQRGLTEVKA
jgi:Na+-driven multidrug efflux pump